MIKLFQTAFLILLMTSNINAQSTERFIRIIGSAKKEVKAKKAKIYFSISELKENKHQKTESKSYDEVYAEFIAKFEELDFNAIAINKSYKKRKSYNKIDSKNFFIESDINSLDKLMSIKIKGFQISAVKYLTLLDENIETELSLQAIEDAKRKASAICNRVKMKLGKILNIEVKSNGFDKKTNESKEASSIKTYKVSITYKLID